MSSCYVSFVVLFNFVMSVTVHEVTHNIIADTKEELPPIYVKCGLNDIIIISAPLVNHNITFFELTGPKGDTRKLDISLTKDALTPDSHENSIVVKYNRKKHRLITLLNNYIKFNPNTRQSDFKSEDELENISYNNRPNDFMIGPVNEEDHGNWVLSLFAQEDGKWLEMFQVIDIQITEYISPYEKSKNLHKGDTFRFGFAYPITNLESCEFVAPKTTFDRWYDRDQDNLDSCMFVIKNVTKDDEGLWMLVGVGRIVFTTQVFLNVN